MKKGMIVLLLVMVIIQFFHPVKNTSLTNGSFDISTKYILPDSVAKVLKVACYDCHSNNTRYPWYNNIQPVAWWLDSHIRDGKNALNFSEFTSYSPGRQDSSFSGKSNEVKEEGMPLYSYTLIHLDAKLSIDQKKMLSSWALAQHDRVGKATDTLIRY